MCIKIFLLGIIFSCGALAQSTGLEFENKCFWALSVQNADSASQWYERVFDLKLLKEIIAKDKSHHIRIVGNSHVLVEIVELASSKSLTDVLGKEARPHAVWGIFKTGFYVKDIAKAEQYLKDRHVPLKYTTFDDKEVGAKSFIIEDLEGNLIQLFQSI